MRQTPLFFTCAIFVTGLTRGSVRLLTSAPPGCGHACVALPVGVLTTLISLLLLTACDLLRLRAKLAADIKWQPAARIDTPNKVGDPYMRLAAAVG